MMDTLINVFYSSHIIMTPLTVQEVPKQPCPKPLPPLSVLIFFFFLDYSLILELSSQSTTKKASETLDFPYPNIPQEYTRTKNETNENENLGFLRPLSTSGFCAGWT